MAFSPLALLRRFTVDQWRAIDAETEPLPPGSNPHLHVAAVLVGAAVALTLQEYLGSHTTYETLWPPQFEDVADDSKSYYELGNFAWWALWRVIGYLVVPMIALAIAGERVRDYHLSPRGFIKHLPLYGVLFAIVLPCVVLASHTEGFRSIYPFYRSANRSAFDLWAWEACYAMQFLALEFFFRGYLLHGLRRVLGSNAIFVMVVPYCMIHFGKPWPETLGAIVAGTALGTIALRTRSIWGGVLIHVGVALTMDLLAVRYLPGAFPES